MLARLKAYLRISADPHAASGSILQAPLMVSKRRKAFFSFVSLQALGASEQCKPQLQTAVQLLLGRFAQPILDRIAHEQVPDFSQKYGSSYSATQENFLYDHVKVWMRVFMRMHSPLTMVLGVMQYMWICMNALQSKVVCSVSSTYSIHLKNSEIQHIFSLM